MSHPRVQGPSGNLTGSSLHYQTTTGGQPGNNSSFHVNSNIYSTQGSGGGGTGHESIVNNWIGDNMLNSFHTEGAKGQQQQQPTQRVQVIENLHVQGGATSGSQSNSQKK